MENKGIKKKKKKWLIALAIVVMIPVFLLGVLSLPFVQTFIAKKIAASISKDIGARVSIDKVRVTFSLNAVVKGLKIEDRKGNDLLRAKEIFLDIKRIRFGSKQVELNKVAIKELNINATKYVGDDFTNFQFILDYLASDMEKEPDEKKWSVKSNAIEIVSSGCSFHDLNKEPELLTFDPSHFSISDFSFAARNLFARNDTVGFEVHRFAFFESEHFQMRRFSGDFLVSSNKIDINNLVVNTGGSELSLFASINIDNGGQELDLFEDVLVELSIENSVIDLKELGYFVNPLHGIEGPMTLEGKLRGKLANIRGSDLNITNQNGTSLKGNFHLTGLPNVDETFFMATMEELRTSISEISSFKLPHSSSSKFLQVPSGLAALGRINFRGNLTGFLYDFVAFGQFNTSIGRLSSDISLKQNDRTGHISYSGRLIADNFDLGRLANFKDIGKISLDANIRGSGVTTETTRIEMSGVIKNLDFLDYDYENIQIAGDFSNRRFNGELKVSDPNVSLDFLGIVNFEEQVPVFDFEATVENANLTRLNWYNRDPSFDSFFSGLLKINAQASGIGDWVGSASIDNLRYEEKHSDGTTASVFSSAKIELENNVINENGKEILLRSDFLDARMLGKFRFDKFGETLATFGHKYAPVLFETTYPTSENYFANAVFQVNFKETSTLTSIFFPSINISKGTLVTGSFGETADQIQLEVVFPEITLAGNHFSDGKLVSSPHNGVYKMDLEFEVASLKQNIVMENFRFTGSIADNQLTTDLRWNNLTSVKDNFGNINATINFADIEDITATILPSYVVVNNSNWIVDTENKVKISPSRIEVSCIELQGDDYSLVVDGIIGKDPNDKLLFSIDDIDAGDMWYLVDDPSFDFGGKISGVISLSGLMNSTGIEADIQTEDFQFNNVLLGNLELKSYFNSEIEAFEIDMSVTNDFDNSINIPLSASGRIFAGKREQNFDVDIVLQDLDMSIWGRFLQSFANSFEARGTGKFGLRGPFHDVELTGRIKLTDGLIEVGFLNTTYSFENDLVLQKNRFSLPDLKLSDTMGNTGFVRGSINHDRFAQLALDLNIGFNKMEVLSISPQNFEVFYGNAFASGNAWITGPLQAIVIDIKCRTDRGTQIFFPLQGSEMLREKSFITFVTTKEETKEVFVPEMPKGSLALNFEIEVTPDAETQIIFDQRTGELIRGRGDGNLRINISPEGDFSIFGDYIIAEGDYIFKLQDLITWEFRIEPGGTIKWFGGPLDAEVNIKAVYPLKATLFDLFADFADVSDAYRRRVPVETNLYLTERLYPSTISFDISIPGAGEEIVQRLEEIISTDEEMANQVFSLLVFERFIPAGSGFFDANFSGPNAVGTVAELLTSQINNWLSQISRYFDIGIKFRPGDNISGEEYELALSTRLFDDRLIIDGSIGYAANNPFMPAASNIIGDVNFEYKLNPEGTLRFKAFNRTNTFDIDKLDSPYTQGVGIFYRRDFNRLSELFRQGLRAEGTQFQTSDVEEEIGGEKQEENNE